MPVVAAAPVQEALSVEVVSGSKLINITLKGDMHRLLVGSIKKSIEPYAEDSGGFDLELDGAALRDDATASEAGIRSGCRLYVRPQVAVLSVSSSPMHNHSSPPQKMTMTSTSSVPTGHNQHGAHAGSSAHRASTPPPRAASPYHRNVELLQQRIATGGNANGGQQGVPQGGGAQALYGVHLPGNHAVSHEPFGGVVDSSGATNRKMRALFAA